MSERLLTTREVAERLGRSRDFVMGLIRSRRLACVQVGARYYVPEWSLDELIRPVDDQAPAASFPRAIYVRGKRVA